MFVTLIIVFKTFFLSGKRSKPRMTMKERQNTNKQYGLFHQTVTYNRNKNGEYDLVLSTSHVTDRKNIFFSIWNLPRKKTRLFVLFARTLRTHAQIVPFSRRRTVSLFNRDARRNGC